MSQSESGTADRTEAGSKVAERFENSSHGQEFSHDITNTVEMVLKAYDKLWFPVIFEGVQNSTEGWIYNTAEGNIPERDLEISFRVDTESGTIVWEDNAGGMLAEKLNDKFLGLDTPGEEKQGGDMGGGYGRGSVALLALGEKFYAETKHASGHVSANGCVTSAKVAHSDVSDDTLGRLDEYGTHVELKNVENDVLTGLADTDAVMQELLEKFPGIVQRDDVTINYVVDGEDVEIPDLDLDALREKAESWTFDSLPSVTVKGKERQVKNLHVVDARELERDAPWKGVLLLKSDKYSEKPWMSIDDYNPVGVRALSDEEMFAWADVSEFCPDCEDAGHEGFVHVSKSDMGIKSRLRELNNDHFRPDAAEQRREAERKAKKELNSLFSEYEAFAEFSDDGGQKPSLDGIETTYSGPSRVTVSPPLGEVTASGEARFEITVDGKNVESGDGTVEVYHLILRDSETGQEVATFDPTSVETGEQQTVTKTVEIPSEGRYSFSAWLRDGDDGERIDKSHVNFKTENASTGEESSGSLSNPTDVGVISDVEVITLPEEVDRKYKTQVVDDGLEIYVNEDWPAISKTFRWGQKKRSTEQKALLTRFGIEAAFEWLIENPGEVGKQRKTLKETRDDMLRTLWEKYEDENVEIAFC